MSPSTDQDILEKGRLDEPQYRSGHFGEGKAG